MRAHYRVKNTISQLRTYVETYPSEKTTGRSISPADPVLFARVRSHVTFDIAPRQQGVNLVIPYLK